MTVRNLPSSGSGRAKPAIGEDTEKLFLRALSLVQRLLDALPRHEANARAQVLMDWPVKNAGTDGNARGAA